MKQGLFQKQESFMANGRWARSSNLLRGIGCVLTALMMGCNSYVSPSNWSDGSGTSTGQSVHQTVYSDAPYSHSKVVCDPFANAGGDNGDMAKFGIRGNLYYMPPGPLQNTYHRVDDYIEHGINTGVFIFLDKIFVPTRMFDRGFEAMDGHILQTNTGDRLMEWFAVNFETQIGLGSADPNGLYQLAVLSDDGAVLSIKDHTSDQPVEEQSWQTLIDNDLWTPTRMACATQAISFQALDRMPVRLRYFQGPRYHIALTVLWRKVTANTPASLNEPLCGEAGNYLFHNPDTVPSTPQQAFLNLQSRGWKVLSENNYNLPPEVRPAPCQSF